MFVVVCGGKGLYLWCCVVECACVCGGVWWKRFVFVAVYGKMSMHLSRPMVEVLMNLNRPMVESYTYISVGTWVVYVGISVGLYRNGVYSKSPFE